MTNFKRPVTPGPMIVCACGNYARKIGLFEFQCVSCGKIIDLSKPITQPSKQKGGQMTL